MVELSGHWVTVRGGTVLLWARGYNTPLCAVTRDATNAVVYGDSIIVQHRDGRAMEFRITRSGSTAVPVRRLN